MSEVPKYLYSVISTLQIADFKLNGLLRNFIYRDLYILVVDTVDLN